MNQIQTTQLILLLESKGVRFESWLSPNEIIEIEQKFDFTFPPDLNAFLQTGLPESEGFINWRKGLINKADAENIISSLNWPLEGILFDLQSEEFWLSIWGTRPAAYKDKIAVVKNYFKHYPKLIPIYYHRYISSEPNEIGNPIFSVYQADIIYYGFDLANYFANEFNFSLPHNFEVLGKPKRDINFWSWCVENN